MKTKQLAILTVTLFLVTPGMAQSEIPTRDMNAINWMDFKAWVPSKVQTVLLPVGTIEAHGVVNNGADNTVPEALARDLAPQVDALIAPTIPYGITTSLNAFAGGLRISEEVFKAYCKEVIQGLAKAGFKNLIVINGHGPNFKLLEEACAEVSEATGLRTLVLNWWSYTADVTMDVYGMEGGHAGVNENAAVQATNPEFVHQGYYDKELAWWREEGVTAHPFPGSIILYKEGEGYPDFDEEKAKLFYSKVVDKLEKLIKTAVSKWERM